MAYTTINKPSLHFKTLLYTGNSSANHAITGVGFAPDLVWQKRRDSTNDHVWFDTSRGATKFLQSAGSAAEKTSAANQDTQSLDSDGFTVGTPTQAGGINAGSCVAWNWKANGGTTSSNTSGSVTTTVQANTTAGFSIVTYTGDGNAATFGHGLGAVPSAIIIKQRNTTRNWYTKSNAMGSGYNLQLDTQNNRFNSASYNAGIIDDLDNATTFNITKSGSTDPTNVNGSGGSYIAWCFAEKKGFSKFGSYTGNGNADGTFVYTGFKPGLIIIKNLTENDDWLMYDTKREGYNVDNDALRPSLTNAEATDDDLDILSNGFKLRRNIGTINNSSRDYIYFAWAEEPLVANVGTGVPATAR